MMQRNNTEFLFTKEKVKKEQIRLKLLKQQEELLSKLTSINKQLSNIEENDEVQQSLFSTTLSYIENKGIKPSAAEAIIITILRRNKIPYLREVSFEGFTSAKGGSYRFDFYFPDKNLIIEYDGENYHKNKEKDKIKDEFCKKNKINIVRLSKKHYYRLEKVLKNLLK